MQVYFNLRAIPTEVYKSIRLKMPKHVTEILKKAPHNPVPKQMRRLPGGSAILRSM